LFLYLKGIKKFGVFLQSKNEVGSVKHKSDLAPGQSWKHWAADPFHRRFLLAEAPIAMNQHTRIIPEAKHPLLVLRTEKLTIIPDNG